jgi:preprotein translocase subunit SecG
MYVVLVFLVVIVSLILIGIVMSQESKSVISASFDNFKRSFGYHAANALVEKATWIFAFILVMICIVIAYFI